MFKPCLLLLFVFKILFCHYNVKKFKEPSQIHEASIFLAHNFLKLGWLFHSLDFGEINLFI